MRKPLYRQADRYLAGFIPVHLVLALVFAAYYDTWFVTVTVSACAAGMFFLTAYLLPGHFVTRCVAGLSLATFVALHIFQMHGMPEMHFFFFTGYAVMVVYTDWRCLWPGVALIAVHHSTFAWMQNSGVPDIVLLTDPYISLSKFLIHMGIAVMHAVICSYWAHYFRSRILRDAAIQKALKASEARNRALVSEMRKTGVEVTNAAARIAATAVEQKMTSSDVARTAGAVGGSAIEISTTAGELMKSVGAVHETAERTARLADASRDDLTGMSDSMNRIMTSTSGLTARLFDLNDKAGNITFVVQTIKKVADHTNLLSLNAAIEAEKAGESGRGFSVVATEIRRLSDETVIATADIDRIVKEILAAVRQGASGVAAYSHELKSGVDLVQSVGAQLSEIISQVRLLAERIEEVNNRTISQAKASRRISDAVNTLAGNIRQTAESLAASSESIRSLQQSSTLLNADSTNSEDLDAAA